MMQSNELSNESLWKVIEFVAEMVALELHCKLTLFVGAFVFQALELFCAGNAEKSRSTTNEDATAQHRDWNRMNSNESDWAAFLNDVRVELELC